MGFLLGFIVGGACVFLFLVMGAALVISGRESEAERAREEGE